MFFWGDGMRAIFVALKIIFNLKKLALKLGTKIRNTIA
jgi:hypothetical protein